MTPLDVNLQLADYTTPLGASGSTTAIECEGGFYAIIRCKGKTITDADETFDLVIEASVDDEGTFGGITAFPQIVATDDDIEIARVCYIPRPVLATPVEVTHVRVTWVAAGTTPSWPVDIWIEPLLSLGVPAIDEGLLKGLCELKAA
jgi:hypothetical protein